MTSDGLNSHNHGARGLHKERHNPPRHSAAPSGQSIFTKYDLPLRENINLAFHVTVHGHPHLNMVAAIRDANVSRCGISQ